MQISKAIFLSVIVYVIWTTATYFFEGRINLLQRPDITGRFIYSIITNMLLGTILSLVALRVLISCRTLTLKSAGFASLKQTLEWSGIAALLGFILLAVQQPVTFNPVVILNTFSQTLPVSIAEIMVCYSLIGTTVEVGARYKRRFVSIIAAIIVSTLVFGIYHFAHSPPFNNPNMVLFIMIPGIFTGVMFFISRSVFATIIFHNFQGAFGVMKSINLESFNHPAYPIIVLGLISITLLFIAQAFIVRR